MIMDPVVLVHGGAGDIPQSRVKAKLDGVKKAALEGYHLLVAGGACLDAAELATCALENDPAFNAGFGSVLTLDGHVEMDALIIEGATMKAGAVAAVRNVAHPITLARMVMEKTPHVILSGSGACEFARCMGVQQIPEECLITPYALEALHVFKTQGIGTSEIGEVWEQGTVGVLTLDKMGHLASATSTGGMTGQLAGRVGDTPIIGSGGYCEDEVGAVSATGNGEDIMRVCLARLVAEEMSKGKDPSQAVEDAIKYMEERVEGRGGAIALSNSGVPGFYFNSKRMAWACCKGGKLSYGIEQGQYIEENISQYSGESSDEVSDERLSH